MNLNANDTIRYTGRFAPSPSGPLHFGSLLTAIASYLDARSNNGIWLLRIDNIDPPREPRGAIESILKTLDNFGLYWDKKEIYQSDRYPVYQSALSQLSEQGRLFYCQCTRAKLSSSNIYPGFCHSNTSEIPESAVRIQIDEGVLTFNDGLQGNFNIDKQTEIGDFILRRKDQLWAYQLATALDDSLDGITHVVRGIDLLESSYRQVWLQQILKTPSPDYAHLPVIVGKNGQKLSKQNHAEPVESYGIRNSLLTAFNLLGLPEVPDMETKDLLDWATNNWDLSRLKNKKEILMPKL